VVIADGAVLYDLPARLDLLPLLTLSPPPSFPPFFPPFFPVGKECRIFRLPGRDSRLVIANAFACLPFSRFPFFFFSSRKRFDIWRLAGIDRGPTEGIHGKVSLPSPPLSFSCKTVMKRIWWGVGRPPRGAWYKIDRSPHSLFCTPRPFFFFSLPPPPLFFFSSPSAI